MVYTLGPTKILKSRAFLTLTSNLFTALLHCFKDCVNATQIRVCLSIRSRANQGVQAKRVLRDLG